MQICHDYLEHGSIDQLLAFGATNGGDPLHHRFQLMGRYKIHGRAQSTNSNGEIVIFTFFVRVCACTTYAERRATGVLIQHSRDQPSRNSAVPLTDVESLTLLHGQGSSDLTHHLDVVTRHGGLGLALLCALGPSENHCLVW